MAMAAPAIDLQFRPSTRPDSQTSVPASMRQRPSERPGILASGDRHIATLQERDDCCALGAAAGDGRSGQQQAVALDDLGSGRRTPSVGTGEVQQVGGAETGKLVSRAHGMRIGPRSGSPAHLDLRAAVFGCLVHRPTHLQWRGGAPGQEDGGIVGPTLAGSAAREAISFLTSNPVSPVCPGRMRQQVEPARCRYAVAWIIWTRRRSH